MTEEDAIAALPRMSSEAKAYDADYRLRQAPYLEKTERGRELRWQAILEGQLWWLLDSLQYARVYIPFYQAPKTRIVLEDSEASLHNTFVAALGRRVGKTMTWLVLALECILRGGNYVKYAAKTQKDVAKMVEPSMRKIMEWFPEDLRAVDKPVKDGNGWIVTAREAHRGLIDVAGCDDERIENLRGQEADLWIVDEGGFVSDLMYVVSSVLSPQTITTRGRGVVGSSPSESLAHPFRSLYFAAKANGSSAHATLWDSPRLTQAEKVAYVLRDAKQLGMTLQEYVLSTTYQREVMALFVQETSLAVLPCFTKELRAKVEQSPADWPMMADWYTVIDLGGSRDPTGILVGYLDYRTGILWWVGEMLLANPTMEQLYVEIITLEKSCFGANDALRGRIFRIMDDDQGFVRRELAKKYHYSTTPPKKDDKQASIMEYQAALGRGEVHFCPELRHTLTQHEAGIWNEKHTEYQRLPGMGHLDLLDCALYGHRNVRTSSHNVQIPEWWGQARREGTWIQKRAAGRRDTAHKIRRFFAS